MLPHRLDATPMLDALLARLGRMVRAVGGRHALGADEIDALVQEVRIRIWRAHPESEEIERLPTSYVYRTAMAAAIDLLRQRRRHVERAAPLEEAGAVTAGSAATADAAVLAAELGAAIDRALASMVEARRVVVRMHLAGYGREEMVAMLGWPDGKVRNLLYRGMDDLRERLVRAGYRWPEER